MTAPIITFVETSAGAVDYTSTDVNPINLGDIKAGALKKKQIYVKNASAAVDLQQAEVEALEHEDAQLGSAASTYDVTTFSASETGTFTATLSLGTVTAETSSTYFWLKYAPPSGATSGARTWALQITGNYEA